MTPFRAYVRANRARALTAALAVAAVVWCVAYAINAAVTGGT